MTAASDTNQDDFYWLEKTFLYAEGKGSNNMSLGAGIIEKMNSINPKQRRLSGEKFQ